MKAPSPAAGQSGLTRLVTRVRALAADGQWALMGEVAGKKIAAALRSGVESVQAIGRPARDPARIVEALKGVGAADGRRVLWLIPTFTAGGAEAVDLALIRSLRAAGWRIVACAETHRDARWRERFAADVEVALALDEWAGAKQGLDAARALLRALKPDLVFVRHSKLGYALTADAQAQGARAVDLIHTVTRFGDWIDDAAPHARQLDLRIATTREVAEALRERGGAAEAQILLAPNGIDFSSVPIGAALGEKRARTRAELGADAATPVIGFLGRLVAEKDLERWLRIAALIQARAPNVRFVIAGDGPQRRRVEAVARGLGSAVKVTGPVSDPYEWYAAFDVFLMTSRYEGLPLAPLEAAASGCPVLSTAVGELGHAISAEIGETLPPATSDAAFAERALALAQRRLGDAAWSNAIRAYARKHFDQDAASTAILTSIETLVAKS